MVSSAERLEITSLSTAVLVLLLVVWALLGTRLRHGLIPEGTLAALLGLLTGILILAFQKYMLHGIIRKLMVFDSSAFLVYLLPPVIFHAGLSVQKRMFFANLGTILVLGVLGTIASFLIMSVFLSALAGFHMLRFQDCLALGAIMSATDSVATLQVLDAETMPLLFSLVFGEGIINDATSVVLLGAISRVFPPSDGALPSPAAETNSSSPAGHPAPEDAAQHTSHALGLAVSFLYLYSTSLVLGVATGLAIAFLMRHVIHDAGAHREMALVGMLSYLAYLAAELSGLSGILCLFCCGIAVSHWALPQMSSLGATVTTEAFQTLSHLAEGVIFLYVGMDALDPIKWQAASPGEAVPMCLMLLLLLLVSRAVGVLPLALLHNIWSPNHLTSRDLAIIWWSGLMRGAVSVALVYFFFDTTVMDEQRATIISSTLVTVLFTTVFFGILTKPFLALLLEDRPDRPLGAVLEERLGCLNGCLGRLRLMINPTKGYQQLSATEGPQAPAAGASEMADLGSRPPHQAVIVVATERTEADKVAPSPPRSPPPPAPPKSPVPGRAGSSRLERSRASMLQLGSKAQ